MAAAERVDLGMKEVSIQRPSLWQVSEWQWLMSQMVHASASSWTCQPSIASAKSTVFASSSAGTLQLHHAPHAPQLSQSAPQVVGQTPLAT